MWPGIILDFDGVILKSMENHAEAYRRVLEPLGVPVEPRQVFLQEGARSETIIAEFLHRAGKRLPREEVERLSEQKQRLYRTMGSRLYPGAESMVERIRKATRSLGLVTGTRRENLPQFIPHLMGLFDLMLAAKDYTHDKPHPEPYAMAAQRMSVAPSGCAVVENAVRGVQSAKAAGVGFVIGITTTMPAHELEQAGADAVVADHADVAAMLERRMPQ